MPHPDAFGWQGGEFGQGRGRTGQPQTAQDVSSLGSGELDFGLEPHLHIVGEHWPAPRLGKQGMDRQCAVLASALE